jgi:hypothetical protein
MQVELPDSLVQELTELAAGQGATFGEVLADSVRLGLDTMLVGSTTERLDTIERMVSAAVARLDVLGPSSLGASRLLAMWASKADLKIQEEDAQAEIDAIGTMEWELELTRRGMLSVSGPVSPDDSEESSGTRG